MTDTDSVQLSSDSNVVPDSGPLADEHIADKCGVGGDPSVTDLGDSLVEGHSLAMTR